MPKHQNSLFELNREGRHVNSKPATSGAARLPAAARSGVRPFSARARRDDVLPLSRTARAVARAGRAFDLLRKSAHGALFTFLQKCTRCTFHFPALRLPLAFSLALPLAAIAADAEGSRVITLDVAGGGVLGGLCTALVMWLNNQRKQQRQPPLGEDVARTYATKDELTQCRTSCRKDIDDIRAKIDDNDKKDEDRARGTHARIDALYHRESQKMTKSLGMLIGIMVGKGIAPAATALNSEQGE